MAPTGPVWAVVVAAGTGDRFGGQKQFAQLAGRPVVAWSVAAASTVADGVVLVLPEGAMGESYGAGVCVIGGPTRSASVRRGLASVPESAELVVVHDAARPLATEALFRSVLAALDDPEVGGAVCAVPVADTLKRVEGGVATATVERSGLMAVQTPQAFRAGVLRRAHASAGEATDDAALVEALGATVRVVPGDPRNIKLTTQADLVYAEHLLGQLSVRIGQGFDLHPYSDDPARHLVLGGVVVTEGRGLLGHSDADAASHAVADALLGAAGLGDLGMHFPDGDPEWAGADSIDLLRRVVALVASAGWRPVNVDCTIVAEAPLLAPYVPQMAERLGAVVGAPVSVKATRAEGLGALGRSEGVACLAVALLEDAPATAAAPATGPGSE